jgi:putative N6-adenine-specific DNA methylase
MPIFNRIADNEQQKAPEPQQPLVADGVPRLRFVARTMEGLEPVLMTELEALGAADIRPLKRAVSFEGDYRLLYRANYELRTALRVFMPIHQFVTSNPRNFYTHVREIDWSKYMDVDDSLAVDATVAGDYFKHSHYVALTTKDAIVDQFRDKYNRRPDVNTIAPTLRIYTRINGAQCELLLDASGDSLHRRNYRRDATTAPINEVLAAGMLLLAGWDGSRPFADPMCGSGTLAIEAAMMARRMPIQMLREGFGFMKWKDFDRKLWADVQAKANAQRLDECPYPVFAYDKDPRARNATAINLMAAGLEGSITVERMAFERLTAPASAGLLVTNPPYDERLQVEEIVTFYKGIGDRLKHHWPGWDAWIISSNRDALKHLGLRPSRRITLFNGALECSFQRFSMYEGKKGTGVMESDDPNDPNAD